jgi:hypothetical protein
MENVNDDILIQIFDQMQDQIHDDRKLAVGLLTRADKLEETIGIFMQSVAVEDIGQDADVIPLRDTDGDQ